MIPNTISKRVLTMGVDYHNPKGGIAQVLYAYSQIFETFRFIPTTNSKNFFSRQMTGIIAALKLLSLLLRKEIKIDINGMIELVKEVSDVPCAVGFGISTPKQAEDVCKYADGAIVGSAIVRIVAEHGKDSVQYVSQYVKEMKDVVRG